MRVAGQSQAPAQWERSASLVVAACKRPPGQSQGAAHGWGRPSQAGRPSLPGSPADPQTRPSDPEIWAGSQLASATTPNAVQHKGLPSNSQCLHHAAVVLLVEQVRGELPAYVPSCHNCHIVGPARHACCGRFQTAFILTGDGRRHVTKAVLRQTIWAPESSTVGLGC